MKYPYLLYKSLTVALFIHQIASATEKMVNVSSSSMAQENHRMVELASEIPTSTASSTVTREEQNLYTLHAAHEQTPAISTIPKCFTEMSDQEYNEHIKSFFNPDLHRKEKAARLIEWSTMVSVPILALRHHSLFFYANLHICPLQEVPDIEFDKNEGIEDKVTTFFYDDKIRIVDSMGRVTKEFTKEVTADLRRNTLCYLYKSKYDKFFDTDKFNADSDAHYLNFPFEQDGIAREFLAGYIIPLEEVKYLDEIIAGIKLLPKAVVEMMRGKAIYFSNARGISRTIFTAHCQLITNYLGLMSGVFVERHKDKGQITETFIHEIGHLIDHTVLQPFYTSKGHRSIRFYYQFLEVQKLYPDREKHFTGNPSYKENKSNDKAKGKAGFLTNYSEKNREEDFAEHFVHFIMHKKRFDEKMREEAGQKDFRLLQKFMFMSKLIEKTSVQFTLPPSAASAASSCTHTQ